MIKVELGSILEKLTQRHNQREQARRFHRSQDGCENKTFAFGHFLQIQKNQLIDLQELLEPYCNVYLYGFNSSKYDIILIKSYLLSSLFNQQDGEPAVVKESGPIHLAQFGWFSAIGFNEFSWRCIKS